MISKEENPFEDPKVAKDWISWMETPDSGGTRYTETYPRVKGWLRKVKPKTVVDIGAGQGIISEYLGSDDMQYIGVDSSVSLIERAKNLYKEKNKKFIVGSAYNLPLSDNAVDAVFSVNVWFHLKDLEKATKELFRILEPDGKFLVITANPKRYDVWKSFFVDPEEKDSLVSGKFFIRQGQSLSRNNMFFHSFEKITGTLEAGGLVIDEIDNFGYKKEYDDDGLMIAIKGHKPIS